MRKEVIGNVTLWHGDSLALLRERAFGKVGAIVSDPPYGIGYQHGGSDADRTSARPGVKSRASSASKIEGDDAPFDPQPWIALAPASREKGLNGGARHILLWGADHFRTRLPEGGTLLAWDKHIGKGPDDSFVDCEWAWCGRTVRREVFRLLWKGVLRDKTNPFDNSANGSPRRLHVSQKPVELMRWCIDKARPLTGLPVLDPYIGSGSTLIAAMTLGLPAIGVEIDEAIFETACERVREAHRAIGA